MNIRVLLRRRPCLSLSDHTEGMGEPIALGRAVICHVIPYCRDKFKIATIDVITASPSTSTTVIPRRKHLPTIASLICTNVQHNR